MAKVLVSFLGTGNYEYCNYVYEGKKISEVRFIQEAIAKIFCEDWSENDKIRIFTTEEAYKQHWENNIEKEIEGLSERLSNLNLKIDIKQISIQTGTKKNASLSEINNGILSIFDTVYNEISENDEVIYDITHAFRFFPMLGLVLLNYGKLLKNIKIDKILYGAFEVIGNPKEVSSIPMLKRDAPIVDLTYLSLLQEWTSGANEFLNFGSIDKISKLTQQEIKPILIQSQGQDENANLLRDFSKEIQNLINNIKTCRGRELLQGDKIKKIKKNIETLKNSFIKPLNPILNKLSSKIEKFTEGENIKNGFASVEWCIDNGLVQQGFTLLLENIITFIVMRKELDYKNETYRNIVSSCFTIISQKIEQEKWTGDAKEYPELTKSILELKILDDLKGEYESIGKFRNDINHSGFKDDARQAKDFEPKLKQSFEKIKALIRHEI